MKRMLVFLYIAVVVSMAVATIIEKYQGTAYVADHVYGAWWFSVLWAMLTAVAVFYFVRRKVRRAAVVALHLSFVVILAGALLTHLTGRQGMIHLREGEQTQQFLTAGGPHGAVCQLPFSVRLDTFAVVYHDGTTAAADYVSRLTIADGKQQLHAQVSMNKIFSHRGIRFYQGSYDEDGQGSVLAVNSDPWGIPVTYTGYALLFVSLVWMLIDPRGRFRRLLRQTRAGTGRMQRGARVMATVGACLIASLSSAAPGTLPKETARQFGQLYILYNDRICPLQTFAVDFTKKLYGKPHYGEYTAEQVLAGFIFWGDEWSNEPILKMKGGPLRSTLQLPKYCSVNTFFNPSMGGYILGPYVRQYYMGNNDKFHQDVGKVDDRLQLIMELRQGKLLKIFPYTRHSTTWYSPVDKYPDDINADQQAYMRDVFSLLNEEVHAGRFDRVDTYIAKMQKYQARYGGRSLPSDLRTKAERLYNTVPFATILFMVNLTMAFLLLAVRMFVRKGARARRILTWAAVAVMLAGFLALTLCLALRWIVSGTVPMANGYETMLLMAWLVMLLSLLTWRRFSVMLLFGFLMSGFFLLVSHISQMDPQISHVMPVLSSPLLTIHVSIIMMAYALLSMTFICGVAGLIVGSRQARSLHILSQLFLYPAVSCLGFGIFIGAIWANVSWGTYWSWDPKETWALISLMVYGVAFHDRSWPWLRQSRHFHWFMVLAFLTLLMTYFGVNYFLGGMHSYA